MPLTSPSLLTPFLTGEYAPFVGKHVLSDASIRINGLEHSNYVHSIDLVDETEEIEATQFGSEYKQSEPGLAQVTIDLDMFFGNQPVDQALRDANFNGSQLLVQITPHSARTVATDPVWEGYCIVTHFVGMEGDVGAPLGTTVTLKSTGDVPGFV